MDLPHFEYRPDGTQPIVVQGNHFIRMINKTTFFAELATLRSQAISNIHQHQLLHGGLPVCNQSGFLFCI